MTLANASIGIVPIVFANDDVPELSPPISPETLLDELARLCFSGSQLSRALPPVDVMRSRGIRIAEVYAALPCTSSGPTSEARTLALDRLESLQRTDGDVLVFSYHLSEERVGLAGRAAQSGAPSLTPEGRKRAVELVEEIASATDKLGRPLVYHPHVGTFVETPAEVEWLMESTDPYLVGLCLDVGHYTVGGGDPVAAVRRYGRRIRHVHMKDVDRVVLHQLQTGELGGFLEALRARIFTELGSGILDVLRVVEELSSLNYSGWLMCEQDTTHRPPSESAAISLAVLRYAIRLVDR